MSFRELSATPLRVGCIGGGQLGRMMALEAPRLNIEMYFLDPLGAACPAAKVVGVNAAAEGTRVIEASLQDGDAIRQLAERVQVLTVEIEHVNVQALAELEETLPTVSIQPSSRVLAVIQDKYLQKLHFSQSDQEIPLPPFCLTSSIADIQQAVNTLGLPLMLKSRKGGYDGRGNAVLKQDDLESIHQALRELGIGDDQSSDQNQNLDLYAEGWVDFDCEIAVMVVRSSLASSSSSSSSSSSTQSTRCYPAVNAIQQNSICRVVLAPARNLSASIRKQAEQLAIRAIDALGPGASGVFGVEMFLSSSSSSQQQQQKILINEVAPRPHNTGHYTQDACVCSQFENHLRGICGYPLGSTQMKVNAAAMVNVLGTGDEGTTLASSNAALQQSSDNDNNNNNNNIAQYAAVHWYSKEKDCRRGRKMGHITLTGRSHEELNEPLTKLLELEGIPLSLLPAEKPDKEEDEQEEVILSSSLGGVPLVGVIMGSQSDLPTMHAAVDILKQFQVPYQVDIVSAHRTPDKLLHYSRSAAERGIRVIIAGAGGAAHLPGMVAAMTPLPVIGVPVKTSTLSGVDSLYSIVQMPRGVPVATVAIGNAANAGLLAVRILSIHYPHLLQKMAAYQDNMRDTVLETSAQLLQVGSDAFLAQMDSKSKSVNV